MLQPPIRRFVMQGAQAVATWVGAAALIVLVVLQLGAAPPLATYQTVVTTFADDKLNDALARLSPLGWRFTSCRRASHGEGDAMAWAYECFLERATRTTPDESL